MLRVSLIGFILAQAVVWGQPAPPPPPPALPGAVEPVVVRVGAASGSYLGVGVIEVDAETAEKVGMAEPHGVEIASVAANSPADEAGLKKGDVVAAYRGSRVEGVEHFARLVRETPIGREVRLKIFSASGEREVTATIGRREEQRLLHKAREFSFPMPEIYMQGFSFDIPRPRMSVRNRTLGAEIENLDGQLAEHFGVERGVLVRSVEKKSAAERAGLEAGDVIVSVAGKTVRRTGDVRRAIAGADSDTIPLEVMRDGSKQDLEVEIERRSARKRPGRPAPARRVSGDRL